MTFLSTVAAMICGVVLIALLAPLSQFLTTGAFHANIETSTPNGWALGVVISAVLVMAVIALISKVRLPKGPLVILFSMLAIAVPLMNLGLMRQFYLSISAVYFEYLGYGNSTYRTAYNARPPGWFPAVPTTEGLAWAQAERLVRLLEDTKYSKLRTSARRDALKQVEAGSVPEFSNLKAEDLEVLAEAAEGNPSLSSAIEQARTASVEQSARQLELLEQALAAEGEMVASMLPANRESMDFSSRSRLEATIEQAESASRSALEQKAAALAVQAPQLAEKLADLSEFDRVKLIETLAIGDLMELQQLPPAEVDALRQSFVYRLSQAERRKLLATDGESGGPNMNLTAFRRGLFNDMSGQREKDARNFFENLAVVAGQVPWGLWIGPMLRWGALVLTMLLFLMCLAEWFRRKWVDRENLAFPLVEVVDGVLRHDRELETAAEITDPPQRKSLFNPLFLGGMALGLLILSLEAAGHYEITGVPFILGMDISSDVLASGPLKSLSGMVFVISPIVVGLLFLVNLEISFSIWVIFLIYKFSFWLVAGSTPLRDSLWVGYGGGREFPFQMDQLMGATLCFSALLLVKSFQGAKEKITNPFIPPKLTLAGLIGLPLIMLALLWSMGVTNLPLLLFAAVVLLAQTIAAARARAETGLPTNWNTYEFTRLPMVFGMSGFTGANVFTIFTSVAFLPVTLIMRTFPQHLENMELARRFRIPYKTIAIGAVLAIFTALTVGSVSFLVFSYYFGELFHGTKVFEGFAGNQTGAGIAHYPLWISHFTGEEGLSKFDQIHWIRVWFVLLGAGIFGLLTFLRGRFLRFPLHPLGYLLLLLSIWFTFISPYFQGNQTISARDTSFLWGSALVAWVLKLLIIKYGGMNTYKAAKPFFIGMVAGAVFSIFLWNSADLVASFAAEQGATGTFIEWFTNKPPYSPTVY